MVLVQSGGDGQRLPGWLDNGDSYVCFRCRYETGNPNKLTNGPWTCPRCGTDMGRENTENRGEERMLIITIQVDAPAGQP